MCSGNSRGLNSGKNIKVVGTFIRVLKKDGTLLFKPALADSAFFSKLKYLYHAEFITKWEISSICQVAKGFHINFKDVNDLAKAEFFIGEPFGLYESEIKGRSLDLFIGEVIYVKKSEVMGRVISVSKTPSYMLIEVLKETDETVFVPFTDEFINIRNGKMELIKEI